MGFEQDSEKLCRSEEEVKCIVGRATARTAFQSIRKSVCMGHRILVNFLDTWKWFLTLIMLYVFISYVVKLPILFLGVVHPLYAFAWMGLWILVLAVFLAWREAEHTKAQMSPKWVNNPNAIAEYLFLIEQSSKD